MNRIDDKLFVGDWQDAQEYAPRYFTISLTKESPGGEHLHFPINDDKTNTKTRLLAWIELAITVSKFRDAGFDRDIFIHCAAGQSRSPLFASLVLFYSYKTDFENFLDVLEAVKDKYPAFKPSSSLLQQVRIIVQEDKNGHYEDWI